MNHYVTKIASLEKDITELLRQVLSLNIITIVDSNKNSNDNSNGNSNDKKIVIVLNFRKSFNRKLIMHNWKLIVQKIY